MKTEDKFTIENGNTRKGDSKKYYGRGMFSLHRRGNYRDAASYL
ncbi:MAG: hypothetical protein ACK5MD_08890 [Flavobacteriales bacterium]